MPTPLPPLPATTLRVVDDFTHRARCDEGFIRVRRQKLAARYADGTESEPFLYDQVDRVALDAVVIAAHYEDPAGRMWVFLRSALRPPAAMRPAEAQPVPEPPNVGHLWEVPAGLVEPHERSELGLRECAARELAEELGIHMGPNDMQPLGPPTFPAPALIGERHFYFHCRVDPSSRKQPRGDGSPLEEQARIVAVSLEDALEFVRQGELGDAKTEIALRRLQEI